ncbi:hypothetical protein ZWY2020_047845 [Hordeum vulgare]|nr:hypothetical protein ZWY2020_047845 [Hordeum vulgare]
MHAQGSTGEGAANPNHSRQRDQHLRSKPYPSALARSVAEGKGRTHREPTPAIRHNGTTSPPSSPRTSNALPYRARRQPARRQTYLASHRHVHRDLSPAAEEAGGGLLAAAR